MFFCFIALQPLVFNNLECTQLILSSTYTLTLRKKTGMQKCVESKL